MAHDVYDNPLITRYASRDMAAIFGDQQRYGTWRQLWIALAESQRELGLPVTQEQIDEMRAHADQIDFDAVAAYEREKRHDVVAHIHEFGDRCPLARPIIHLGATSCFVTDNTDLLLMRRGLDLLNQRLAGVIDRLAAFAAEQRSLPCLGFTHLQPAQPTTVGKRATLWQDHALGVLLTPWFMNLVLVPLDQERFATSAPGVGEKVQIALPAGQVEFIVGHEPGFGHSLSCSLFSPVFEFADQDAAEECAKAALVEVLTDPRDETAQDADADFRAVREARLPEPEVEQTKRTPSDVSRRDFLRGGTVEAEPRARA